jgi:hypothetical protein
MPPGASAKRPDQEGRVWIALTFFLAAAVRIGFALAFPTIHGGDAAARLAHADTLVLGYQLPLPQLFVVLGKAISDDPLATRLIFCLWGATLAAGMTAWLTATLGSRAAFFGGILLAFDPLLVHYSIVPYQEPVAYGLVASLDGSQVLRDVANGSVDRAAVLGRQLADLLASRGAHDVLRAAEETAGTI